MLVASWLYYLLLFFFLLYMYIYIHLFVLLFGFVCANGDSVTVLVYAFLLLDNADTYIHKILYLYHVPFCFTKQILKPFYRNAPQHIGTLFSKRILIFKYFASYSYITEPRVTSLPTGQ